MNGRLNLTIKRKWFDMIASGEKREEYRDCKNRQVLSLYRWMGRDLFGWAPANPVAIFRNGYRMDSRAIAVEIVGSDLRDKYDVRHPEWGEPKCRRLHLVVKLGEVIAHETYAEVKEAVR